MVCAFPSPPPSFTDAADRCGSHDGSGGGETFARPTLASTADDVGSVGFITGDEEG